MEKSPITLDNNVEFLYSLDSKKLVSLYKRDFNISVDRFFTEEKVKFYKCKTTGLIYVVDFERIAGDSLFYQELSAKSSAYYNNEKWEFDAVLERLKSNWKVLDVGCGDGYFLEKLIKKGITCSGLELNKNAIDTCLKKGLPVIEKRIEEYALTYPNYYDVVCSFQVFEHLSNPLDVIKASINLVAPGGLLIISVPNNDSEIFKLDPYHTLNLPPHHVLFWDENSLKKVAKYFNLEVVEIIKSPIAQESRGHLYKLILNNYFPLSISSLIHTTTNWFVKRIIQFLIKNKDGATVIAVLKKSK